MPPAKRRREAGVGGHGGFRLGYRPELDGLRGLAVLAVMAYHCDLRRVVPGGFLGVDLFFVLSGFLITALLMREHQQTGRVHLPRFYLRRALRLLPALFVMLAVCCVWAALRTKPDRAAVIYQAALLTACHAANGAACWSVPMDLLSHAWSLSLEEQFYVAWPVLLVLLLRFGATHRRIAWLVGTGIAASALVRAALWLSPWPAGAAATTSLIARADSLLAGCLVGLLASAGRLPQSPGGAPHFAADGGRFDDFSSLARNHGAKCAPYLVLGGYTAVAAAVAVVIAALASSPPPPASRVLGAPALAWVGRISYGLYLWHFPLLSLTPKLIHGFIPMTHRVRGLDVPLAYALAFAAAAVSYYAVERPFLRWKARLGEASSFSLISAHSSIRSGPGTPAASFVRAGCPA